MSRSARRQLPKPKLAARYEVIIYPTSRGTGLAVSDGEILEARRELGRDESAVIFTPGSGLKYLE